jgi:hypothetical protein
MAPPPGSASAGGSRWTDAVEGMDPHVASLGKGQVERIVDLVG